MRSFLKYDKLHDTDLNESVHRVIGHIFKQLISKECTKEYIKFFNENFLNEMKTYCGSEDSCNQEDILLF